MLNLRGFDTHGVANFQMQAFACRDGAVHCSVKKMGPPQCSGKEKACEVSAEFSCEEVVEEEASIGMN